MTNRQIGRYLEHTYRTYHKRSYVAPDPLQHLYRYNEVRDREIAALLAASLALGRVGNIVRIVGQVLGRIGEPYRYVTSGDAQTFFRDFEGFKYRFYGVSDLVELLLAVKGALISFESLENVYAGHASHTLCGFTDELRAQSGGSLKMVADAHKSSCCKRLNLFLRWMVRSDQVDPGGWVSADPAALVIPLDVHMFAIGKALGFIERGTPDMKAARQITERFREIDAADPCRFDFSLSRQGIHPDLDRESWLQRGFVEVA